jgi:hypothetical protein
MRTAYLRTITIAAAAGMVGIGAGAALGSAPTGNAQAIAIARSVAKAYTHIAGVKYTQTGYMEMRDVLGKDSYFSYSDGTGYLPSGWVRATEHGTVGLHDNRVTWAEDILSPQDCGSLCETLPIEMVTIRTKSYWRYYEPVARFACYYKLSGNPPFPVGTEFVDLSGDHYSPPTDDGSALLLHYTYPWTKGRDATETDAVSAHSRLISASHVAIPKGTGAHQPAFTFAAKFTNLSKTPAEPHVVLCG